MSDEKFGSRPPARLPDDGLARSPIAELQRLAVAADSEQARVQALRLLLDRMDRQRERDEARAAAEAQEGEAAGHDELSEYVQGLTGEALDHELDALLTGTVEGALEQRDSTNYPDLIVAFERAVEHRARELADADRIDQEIERRAQERAESMYRSRSFAVVSSESAQTAAEGPEATEAPSDGGAGRPDDHALIAGFPSRQPRRGNGLRPPRSRDWR